MAMSNKVIHHHISGWVKLPLVIQIENIKYGKYGVKRKVYNHFYKKKKLMVDLEICAKFVSK